MIKELSLEEQLWRKCKAIRLARKITVRELAKHLGINEEVIEKIESKKYFSSIKKLAKYKTKDDIQRHHVNDKRHKYQQELSDYLTALNANGDEASPIFEGIQTFDPSFTGIGSKVDYHPKANGGYIPRSYDLVRKNGVKGRSSGNGTGTIASKKRYDSVMDKLRKLQHKDPQGESLSGIEDAVKVALRGN